MESFNEDFAVEVAATLRTSTRFLVNGYKLKKVGDGTQTYVVTIEATDVIVFYGRGIISALEKMGMRFEG